MTTFICLQRSNYIKLFHWKKTITLFSVPFGYSSLLVAKDKKADMLINHILSIRTIGQYFTQMSAEQFLPIKNLQINLNFW